MNQIAITLLKRQSTKVSDLLIRSRFTANSLSSSFFSTTTTDNETLSSDPPSVKLYQYTICPFCNINKALLGYADVKYDFVEVNPLTKAELKPWSGDYKKVPIAIINDEQINGSSEINEALLKNEFVMNHLKSKRWLSEDRNDVDGSNVLMTIDKFTSSSEATRWTDFAKNELAPILYPNICRSISESYQAFQYVDNAENFSKVQKVMIRSIGSVAMYFAASKIKSKRNITDERQVLFDTLYQWEVEGLDGGHKLYSSGLSQPNLGDVAMFGVINSVAGLSAHNEAIQNRDGVVGDWYLRMHNQILGNK